MSKYTSKKIDEILKTTKDDTIKSIFFNLRLVPTFSLMIDATYEPIHQYLVGQYPTLDSDSINSIIAAAACQFIFKSYDRFKQGRDLKNILESRGLTTKVDETKDKLVKLLKIGSDILKDMGYTSGTMAGILGFAVILQPLMMGINELMGRNSDFNIDNMFNYIVLGVTFKGSLFMEKFIQNFVSKYEKEPEIVKKKMEENFIPKEELKDIIKSVILK